MNILIAIDSSPAADLVIEEVAARAWPANARLEVVSVIEASHLWATSEVAQAAADAAQNVVRRAVARLSATGRPVTGTALFGDCRRLIIDRATAGHADLIVLGSQPHTAVERFFTGNTTLTVLRHAPCSTAIMRSGAKDSAPRILIAIDGSAHSAKAVCAMTRRPWPVGTQFRLISVVQLNLPAAHAFFELPLIEDSVVENARSEAMHHSLAAIDDAKRILNTTGLPVSDTVSVLLERPRDVILKEAADWGADLIVVGSHGRHGADLLLLGSTSEGVATHAACSVEVVRN